MIILEGPDGAGKTTLAETLTGLTSLTLHERASTSTGGPVDDIYEWAEADVLTWPVQKLQVYDRHPLISEPIYGSVLRGGFDPRFNGPRSAELYSRLAGYGCVIFCLPDLETVMSNLDGDENQLAGVEQHATELWSAYVNAYHAFKHRYNLPLLYRYDYTRDDIYDVYTITQAHYINWKRKYGNV